MKKIIVIILAFSFVFSGCSIISETISNKEIPNSKQKIEVPINPTSSQIEKSKVLEKYEENSNINDKNATRIAIKNSKDDEDISNKEKIDISLKNNTEKITLFIRKEDVSTTEDSNFPTKITLKVNDSEIKFESLWNDGIKVSIADFDDDDNDVDVYIRRSGTDISSETSIYKINGKKIYKYAEFTHFGGYFLYNSKGEIYYWLNNGNSVEINKKFNYKTQQSEDLKDESLKNELKKCW